MADRVETIVFICEALLNGKRDYAAELARIEYPFIPVIPQEYRRKVGPVPYGGVPIAMELRSKREYSEVTKLRVFLRDGFIDRYSGERLIGPAALRLLSQLLPDEFPCHPNGKMSETHPIHWELFASIDHIMPISEGNSNEIDNLVTTSSTQNARKSSWALHELGMELLPPPTRPQSWDGITQWFMAYVSADPSWKKHDYIRRWYNAGLRVVAAS